MKPRRMLLLGLLGVMLLLACRTASPRPSMPSGGNRPPTAAPPATSPPTAPPTAPQATPLPPIKTANPKPATPAVLKVLNAAQLTPLPTPTPKPGGLGLIPSGDIFSVEYMQMTSCQATDLCSFSPSAPTPDPNDLAVFSVSDTICVVWVEDGRRSTGDAGLEIKVYQNQAELAAGKVEMIGNRVCRIAQIPLTSAGDYQTSIFYSVYELVRTWTIR